MKITETRCDRCKTVIPFSPQPHHIQRNRWLRNHSEKFDEYDLCDSCWEALTAFMKNELEGGKFKPINVCNHHVPCAGPCQTYYVPV